MKNTLTTNIIVEGKQHTIDSAGYLIGEEVGEPYAQLKKEAKDAYETYKANEENKELKNRWLLAAAKEGTKHVELRKALKATKDQIKANKDNKEFKKRLIEKMHNIVNELNAARGPFTVGDITSINTESFITSTCKALNVKDI